MTPDELLALADAATPGPWEADIETGSDGEEYTRNIHMGVRPHAKWRGEIDYDDFIETDGGIYGPSPANARLIALAPDLARLCAEFAEAAAINVEISCRGSSNAQAWSRTRAALAKLSDLEART